MIYHFNYRGKYRQKYSDEIIFRMKKLKGIVKKQSKENQKKTREILVFLDTVLDTVLDTLSLIF